MNNIQFPNAELWKKIQALLGISDFERVVDFTLRITPCEPATVIIKFDSREGVCSHVYTVVDCTLRDIVIEHPGCWYCNRKVQS
jgi:hypothetical protein